MCDERVKIVINDNISQIQTVKFKKKKTILLNR